MKILILGAAGQISRLVIEKILKEKKHSLILFARHGSKRIKISDPSREQIIDGDYTDINLVKKALEGVDAVYLNDVNTTLGVKTVVEAMEDRNVNILIVASILGIYGEVPGAFGKWNERMVGTAGINRQRQAADIIENSNLAYTILRLTWLYNQAGNEAYHLTQKGEPFVGAQVTREAVAQLIVDVIENPADYAKTSIGVSKPNTNWSKPSFY
jgi:uncharacterized protein YbjT (DUF2867 family)